MRYGMYFADLNGKIINRNSKEIYFYPTFVTLVNKFIHTVFFQVIRQSIINLFMCYLVVYTKGRCSLIFGTMYL